MLLPGFGLSVAHAAPPADKVLKDKVARDLRDEAGRLGPAKAKWARDVNGVRQVQAIVVSDGKDPQMSQLRQFVLGTGDSEHAQHAGIQALTVQIPAQVLNALAQRPDVVSVSPNRVTTRTASTLESVTGALVSNVRSTSTKTSYSGFDGSGVGIAVLDSGVMNKH